MEAIKKTDLQEKRVRDQEQNAIPQNVEALGQSLVTERLARVKAERAAAESAKQVAAIGKQMVDIRLALFKGGLL